MFHLISILSWPLTLWPRVFYFHSFVLCKHRALLKTRSKLCSFPVSLLAFSGVLLSTLICRKYVFGYKVTCNGQLWIQEIPIDSCTLIFHLLDENFPREKMILPMTFLWAVSHKAKHASICSFEQSLPKPRIILEAACNPFQITPIIQAKCDLRTTVSMS